MNISCTLSRLVGIALFATVLAASAAEKIQLEPNETVRSLLERQVGKPVTLRLAGGEEFKGTVGKVQGMVIQLLRIKGREYEDAFIDIGKVTAVIIRVREAL